MPATIELHARAKPPVYVRLQPSGGASSRVRLRQAGRTLWRTTFTFPVPGSWLLRAKGASAFVIVAPPLESTFAPLGAAGCAPPSPANATTREARGSHGLWALFAAIADQRTAVLANVLGKDTKIVWRMTSSGEVTFSAISPDGKQVAPNWVEAHAASNWSRPGDEWGTGFTFSQIGCWQIHIERQDAKGDLWVVVRS